MGKYVLYLRVALYRCRVLIVDMCGLDLLLEIDLGTLGAN